MRLKTLAVCALLWLAAPVTWAQQAQPDLIAENLFPPELIMQHQQKLELSEEQKNFFKGEVRKTQLLLTEFQWKLQDEVEKIAALFKPDQVDEQSATAQLEKVLNLERDIKRAQLAFLIRIKNKLTPEQQARLRELRTKARPK